MATFTSSKVAATVMTRCDTNITSVTAEYSIPAGFATSDIVQMIKIPTGASVLEVILSSSAAVGVTANLSVGDSGSTARYISSQAFTATNLVRLGVHGGHGYRYTADSTIDILAASIATPTAGTIVRLTVIYTFQQ